MPDVEEPSTAAPDAKLPTPVEQYLLRRGRNRRIGLVLLILLLASILLGNLWTQLHGGGDWTRFDRQTFVVQSVMAGDQIAIEPVDGGSLTIVKLLGADAHPVASNGQPQAHWGMEAYRALREIAQGKRVMIALPPLTPRTPDGRLHAYVHLEGDSPAVSLNERLIADGHVYADRRREHAFAKQFDQAEQEARRKKRGQWADLRDDQQPAWRQEWLRGLRAVDDGPPTQP